MQHDPMQPAAQARESATVRLLRSSDLPDIMRLKESAGWNQTEQDWQRMLELEPEGCFGVESDGMIVATATALTYGRDLAWIGMVLTHPEHRGKGYARRMMECTMEMLERRGVARAGLDATDMGIGLYRQFGFQDAGGVERWERRATVERVATPAGLAEWVPDAALDRAAFGGVNRDRLLESLAAGGAASVPGEGYAMQRAGSVAAIFAPCVARNRSAARRLLEWFLAQHAGERTYWDILADNHEAVALAEEHGFERRRRLTRMVLQLDCGAGEWRPDNGLMYGIAGFALG